jgi:hypothetical protein
MAGLYYVRARWYDAGMGRFISEDPIGLAGGINNYAYAANDPVNLSDPTGLRPCGAESVGLMIIITSRVGGCDDSHWSDRFFDRMTDQAFSLLGGIQEDRAAFPSECLRLGCKLRNPTPAESTFVANSLSSIRTDHPFCRELQASGRQQVARDLQMWDNPIISVRSDGITPGQMFGNAPFDSRRGGPVMYLYSKFLSDTTVVHEAVHSVRIPTSSWRFYGDYSRTPLGSVHQTAISCLGR